MKNKPTFVLIPRLLILFFFICQGISVSAASVLFQDPSLLYEDYRGSVFDSQSQDPLPAAFLVITGTNISTITNSEGEFFLKVPFEHSEANVTISHLGFQTKTLPSSFFKSGKVEILLTESTEELSEITIFDIDNPKALVQEMLDKKRENYSLEPIYMKAFYRETIQKGNRNVSLSEAVVNVYKKPYNSFSRDDVSLVKGRKTADYERLDTLALKLRGGPFNTLGLDIMKDPDKMFYQEDLGNYLFEFDTPAKINGRHLYVVNFEDLNKSMPWYHGKLYIDAKTKALVKADLELNVDNRKAATSMFVKKKPGGTKVYPLSIIYNAEYREQDGKWYFGYGNTQMEFVVNWRRKLFNSRYRINSEMAVTNWLHTKDSMFPKEDNFIKPDVVMADDVSGFADLGFWGNNNIIEPDKSIENAIEKIQKNLKE